LQESYPACLPVCLPVCLPAWLTFWHAAELCQQLHEAANMLHVSRNYSAGLDV
jgi:hypothetical protein